MIIKYDKVNKMSFISSNIYDNLIHRSSSTLKIPQSSTIPKIPKRDDVVELEKQWQIVQPRRSRKEKKCDKKERKFIVPQCTLSAAIQNYVHLPFKDTAPSRGCALPKVELRSVTWKLKDFHFLREQWLSEGKVDVDFHFRDSFGDFKDDGHADFERKDCKMRRIHLLGPPLETNVQFWNILEQCVSEMEIKPADSTENKLFKRYHNFDKRKGVINISAINEHEELLIVDHPIAIYPEACEFLHMRRSLIHVPSGKRFLGCDYRRGDHCFKYRANFDLLSWANYVDPILQVPILRRKWIPGDLEHDKKTDNSSSVVWYQILMTRKQRDRLVRKVMSAKHHFTYLPTVLMNIMWDYLWYPLDN